ncbi:serine/arginine-rich splicing factor 2-like [Camellia sinensis]|uniref:serine/arginine-rich splicing factor 2-like n=1 Tax=Camellia sinensis TaxID=4442 RepID=UPI001036EFEB|nr:serine/arginine-rich splicing factor 2-like [Camellia sinensis]
MEQQRKGGWIPAVNQWKGGRGKGMEASHGLFSVFVDHIPSKMDAKSLFKFFSKFGIVKDVFIPSKRRVVSHSRFGFVRFDCNVATDIAIQKANGLLVDDKVLEVKAATLDRRKREEHNRRNPEVMKQ